MLTWNPECFEPLPPSDVPPLDDACAETLAYFTATPLPRTPYSNGTRVIARLRDHHIYMFHGVVKASNPDGTYRVQFDDFDQADVAPSRYSKETMGGSRKWKASH